MPPDVQKHQNLAILTWSKCQPILTWTKAVFRCRQKRGLCEVVNWCQNLLS